MNLNTARVQGAHGSRTNEQEIRSHTDQEGPWHCVMVSGV